MRRSFLAIASAVALFACGSGIPGQSDTPKKNLAKQIFAARSAGLTKSQRQGIYDHCSYDVKRFCPWISDADRNYFRKAAACLHDHGEDITDDCSNAFQEICGDDGDQCDFDNDVEGPAYGGADHCKPTENYYGGKCYARCGAGLTFYEGKCLNLQSDPNNCGDIGNTCDTSTGDPCYQGQCVDFCPDTGASADCDGTCTNLSNDFYNCGACGHSCASTTGDSRACSEGQCKVTCDGKICVAPEHGVATCAGPIPLPIDAPIGLHHCDFICDKGYVKSGDGTRCVRESACDPRTEVLIEGHCYYLDGSGGACDPGYKLGSEDVLTNGVFKGKTYKHTVSNNCCIWNSKPTESWGMSSASCNTPGVFNSNDPLFHGSFCDNSKQHFSHQLTLCVK